MKRHKSKREVLSGPIYRGLWNTTTFEGETPELDTVYNEGKEARALVTVRTYSSRLRHFWKCVCKALDLHYETAGELGDKDANGHPYATTFDVIGPGHGLAALLNSPSARAAGVEIDLHKLIVEWSYAIGVRVGGSGIGAGPDKVRHKTNKMEVRDFKTVDGERTFVRKARRETIGAPTRTVPCLPGGRHGCAGSDAECGPNVPAPRTGRMGEAL